MKLSWYGSPGSSIAGYVIHCGVQRRDYPIRIPVGNVTHATVWGLVEGATYYFAVTAYNVVGLESEMSNEVSYTVPSYGLTNSGSSTAFLLGAITGTPPEKSVLTVRTTGDGAVIPDLAGMELVNGKTYSITAKPEPGQTFAGWSGSVVSPVAKLKFVMRPGFVLRADFVPNPFIAAAGTYSGLFYEKDQIRLGKSGLFTITVTSRGAYSGKFQLGKNRLSLSGQLDTQLHAVWTLKLKNGDPLTVQLNVGRDQDTGIITGSLADLGWTAQLLGDRASFNSRTAPAPFAGNYTFVISSATGLATIPNGDGFGAARVDTGGRVKFAGALADGTKINQSVTLSAVGNWPLYVPLYRGRGLVIGWVNFLDEPENDMGTKVEWIKTTGVGGRFYRAGFTNECSLLSSLYTQPVGPKDSVLHLTNATVSFAGGNLAADFANDITLDSNGRVGNLSNNPLKLKFSASTGIFKGSVTDPSDGKSHSFSGVVLQQRNVGAGFMLITDQSSRVLIAP